MKTFARSIDTAAVVALAFSASAEPIVERFEPEFDIFQREVDLAAINPAMPELVLTEIVEFNMGGFQVPVFSNPGYDIFGCDTRPFACEQLASAGGFPGYEANPVGVPIGVGLTGWETAYACFDQVEWPTLMFGSTGFLADCGATGDCPSFYGWYLGRTPPNSCDPVTLTVPLRIGGEQGAWHYGWVAIRVECVEYPGCVNECWGDGIVREDVWTYAGFGYETEPGVPIINGGGLCESDLDFNAVLDLADVQTFAQAFVGTASPADLNNDGIFDLADIQRFIGSFNSGCGL